MFNKIEKIKRSDIIKVYDYFDENDKIFILLEDDKEKMSNFNKYIYDEEEKTIKEIAIRNHGVPIQQTEITKLFQKGTESMCKIHILKNGKSGTGTGFFCSIRHSNLNLNVVLLTNNHILDEEFLKEGKIIEYESGNEIIKQIKITKERRFFTNKDLDYTCIEIFETDKILNYFEINDDIMNGNIAKIINSEIFILQYPNGGEISFSQGNITRIMENKLLHTASTEKGSSGSPIILRNAQYDYKVCGVHFGGTESKNCNFATPMNIIINDIEKKASQINYDKEYFSIDTDNSFENLIILKDGRISGCDNKGQIIIFNKEKYDSIDLTIKLFNKKDIIFYHCQLTNGQIIACSRSIKIIRLKINFFYMETYEIVQEITDSDVAFNKVITLDENKYITSLNNNIIHQYIKRNSGDNFNLKRLWCIGSIREYFLERTNLLKINDNEFVVTSRINHCAQFFIGGDDFMENGKIEKIYTHGFPNSMLKHNSYLLIGGDAGGIYLINLKTYSLIGNVGQNFLRTFSFASLPNGNFLIAAEEDKINPSITECKIEENNIIEIKKKNFAHALNIVTMIPYNNMLITNAQDGTIKFWK